MSRAEERRFDRLLRKVKLNKGVGHGWRLTGGFPRRKMSVQEHNSSIPGYVLPFNTEELIRQSENKGLSENE